MGRHYLGFLIVATFFLLEVACLPANHEETATVIVDLLNQDFQPYQEEREEKSLPPEQLLTEVQDGTAEEIMEKIRAINNALKKPPKRQPINWNNQPHTGGGYIMDKEILEKLQQIIASGKLHGLPDVHRHNENNEHLNDLRYARKLNFVQRNPLTTMPMPYMVNMPLLAIPSVNNMIREYPVGGNMNSVEVGAYQTRDNALPFQIQWPFANFFPIIINDPLLTALNGGGWDHFFSYGQSADVCNRKQKSVHAHLDEHENLLETNHYEHDNSILLDPLNSDSLREGRSFRKRTVSHRSRRQDVENTKSAKKIYSIKPASVKKPTKEINDADQNSKTNVEGEGLRFPFGGFGWFGNKKVVSPPPGFYINKLKVRKGGVAIAGPGGVATAGKGGAAIVGPGGLAYTQPGGLAVAGPAARVVALSPDVNMSSVISRLQQQATTDGSVPQLLQAIPEGKVVATGPVIYYHPKQQSYHGDNGSDSREDGNGSADTDEYRYDGVTFQKGSTKLEDSPFMLFLKPVAHAISAKGTAVANPISQVVIGRDQNGSVVHTPIASAIAGPGGVAHAQSDLYLYEASVQYIPFYGGGKGQYLEVKKNNLGNVTSERIVSEEKISTEIIKNTDDNLLAKLLAANLQSIRSIANNLLKLTTLGRKTGYLGNPEKVRFRTQLSSLAEAASNSIKLIEDIGDNVDALFKKSPVSRRYGQPESDYISEENEGDDGIGVDVPPMYTDDNIESTIAEAKPFGLAVIGQHGLAASRPVGTAIAASGVALARPIATAIAGIDPSVLGLNYQINQFSKH